MSVVKTDLGYIKGDKGDDGTSPTAKVEQTTDGAKITVTDANGTTEAEIKNGTAGAAGATGADGFSPVVTATQTSTGATISVTKKDGTTDTVNIANGAQGPQGDKGDKGDAGATGATGSTPDITATATVDSTTGTPAVTVTKSGTAGKPSFAFNFTGLKGESGSGDGVTVESLNNGVIFNKGKEIYRVFPFLRKGLRIENQNYSNNGIQYHDIYFNISKYNIEEEGEITEDGYYRIARYNVNSAAIKSANFEIYSDVFWTIIVNDYYYGYATPSLSEVPNFKCNVGIAGTNTKGGTYANNGPQYLFMAWGDSDKNYLDFYIKIDTTNMLSDTIKIYTDCPNTSFTKVSEKPSSIISGIKLPIPDPYTQGYVLEMESNKTDIPS